MSERLSLSNELCVFGLLVWVYVLDREGAFPVTV